MRDLDRWKDKVELSLDGRQIFFLFFGSAVAACLIFVVGVLVGKRLEARALALAPPPVEDPLAALDQLGDADEAAEGLTFHKALTHDGVRAKLDEKRAEPKPPVALAAESPRAAPSPRVEPAPNPAHMNDNAAHPSENAAAHTNETANARANAPAHALVAVAPAHAAAAHAPAAAHPAPLPAGRPQVIAAAPKPPVAGHFTLQLSAFPDRGDAEEFVRKIQAAGYKPFLVASEIPGKGTFYRVRVGDFATKQAATDAKTEFERKQRLIAYVAKL